MSHTARHTQFCRFFSPEIWEFFLKIMLHLIVCAILRSPKCLPPRTWPGADKNGARGVTGIAAKVCWPSFIVSGLYYPGSGH
jgi:hypothetical protein